MCRGTRVIDVSCIERSALRWGAIIIILLQGHIKAVSKCVYGRSGPDLGLVRFACDSPCTLFVCVKIVPLVEASFLAGQSMVRFRQVCLVLFSTWISTFSWACIILQTPYEIV